MLIALTGTTGFIGRYLLRELTKRGYRVRALLRRPAAIPTPTASAVIGDLARPQNMSAALAGVDAVIHSAGIAQAMSGVPKDDYRVLNTEGTIKLARAAGRAGAKRFVFLSSIRAQCGPTADMVLTETVEPRPTDPYGKSKLAAERGLRQLDIDWVALRAVLVYGPGVVGNMLALENLLTAIEVVLTAPGTLRRVFIVADPQALTIEEMIAAMRRGLGRRPNVFPFPVGILELLLRAAGREEIYQRLAGPLVADPSALINLRWTPTVATPIGLAELMHATGGEEGAFGIKERPCL